MGKKNLAEHFRRLRVHVVNRIAEHREMIEDYESVILKLENDIEILDNLIAREEGKDEQAKC